MSTLRKYKIPNSGYVGIGDCWDDKLKKYVKIGNITIVEHKDSFTIKLLKDNKEFYSLTYNLENKKIGFSKNIWFNRLNDFYYSKTNSDYLNDNLYKLILFRIPEHCPGDLCILLFNLFTKDILLCNHEREYIVRIDRDYNNFKFYEMDDWYK